MNLLAIDPGPKFSAFAVMEDTRIRHAAKVPTETLLANCTACCPINVVCEHLQCFGLAVGAEVFETAYYIGAFRQKCLERGIAFHRVFRSEVKMALCHSMKANDSNIRQAILDLYGGKEKAIGKKANPGPLYGVSGDMWSALAVGLTWLEKQKLK